MLVNLLCHISIPFLLVLVHFVIFLHKVNYVNENMAFSQEIAKQNYILRKKSIISVNLLYGFSLI